LLALHSSTLPTKKHVANIRIRNGRIVTFLLAGLLPALQLS